MHFPLVSVLLSSFVALGFGLPISSARATEPTLEITTPTQTVSFTRSKLLSLAEKEPVSVEKDPAYKHTPRTYSKVVRITKLFEGLDVQPDSILQFKCLDGFSTALNTARLLADSPKESAAYIAIEDPDKKWDALKSGATPGPFYLIWKNPTFSHISQEEWPFQLSGFVAKKSLRDSFPKLFPKAKLSPTHPVSRGLQVFAKNCFACHTLNLEGESNVGPDLNVPSNPTEYLNAKYLKILVRDPQKLRHWPGAKMKPIPEASLSDAEFKDLVAYLTYMAKHRK